MARYYENAFNADLISGHIHTSSIRVLTHQSVLNVSQTVTRLFTKAGS